MFGPKQIINGVITNIFIYFTPWWRSKREARYEVLFDTGATGMFTHNTLKPVFDTDFDLMDKISYCDNKDCNKSTVLCDHKKFHMSTEECNEACPMVEGKHTCKTVLDCTKLIDVTIHKGLIENEEK